MHPQLEILLEMQDLHSQRRALLEEPTREVESSFFDLEIDEAVRILDKKIEELIGRLEPTVQARYRTIAGSLGRAVVPVVNGICYGCFVAVPTAWASEASRNDRVRVCDQCGRFLYHVD
ncbi:MAG: zinc ribbon domain-containing protein [Gemmatimonadota bacterium]